MWKEYRLDIVNNTIMGTILKTKSLRKAYEAAEKWRAKGFEVELTCHNIHVVDLDFNHVPTEEEPF